MLDELIRKAETAKVVSFDVFDTLFVRPLIDPEDLFDIVGERAGIPGFRAMRQTAQRDAFVAMAQQGRGEISLDDIYACWKGDAVAARALQQIEYDLELELTLPNPRMTETYRRLCAEKPVVLTSDMYLPAAFFDELLRRHGLTASAVFVSSERNATKRDSGELFNVVARAMGVEPSEILHVGDNPVSDIERARERGLQTFHYRDPFEIRRPKLTSITTSVVHALHRVSEDAPVLGSLGEMGYRWGGPAAVGFLAWLERRCEDDGIEKLLFLSRDGYVLDRLARHGAPKKLPSNTYFKGSRVAFMLAATDESNFEASIEFFVAGSHGLKPFELFERIGVAPPADAVMADLGLGPDATVGDANLDRVRLLLSAMRREILKVCLRNRRGLHQGLVAAGVRPGMRVAMVDVGWNGTTQEALQLALDRLMPVQLRGYYLCLVDSEACRRRRRHIRMDALIDTNSVASREVEKLYANRVAAELLFSAPHDAVIGYDPDHGHDCAGVRAVEDPGRGVPPGAAVPAVEEIIRGVERFERDFHKLQESISFQPDALALASVLLDFVEAFSPAQRDLLGSVVDFDAWGSSRNQPMRLSAYLA